MPGISLVLGLGNPGPQYDGTRHNLGFDTLDRIAMRHRLAWRRREGAGRETVWQTAACRVTLVKPQSFMNRSGEALARYAGLPPDELLVICDDIALPLGSLRIRARGGAGGHKGLESIAHRLGTEFFARLRLGVGPAPESEEWSDFVLRRFEQGELEQVRAMVDLAADAVETILARGLEEAQSQFNPRRP